MEQIIKDFRDLLLERQKKFDKLSESNISTEREKDEIQDDFWNDPRRIAYHKLRRHIKFSKIDENQFMDLQNKIFNEKL